MKNVKHSRGWITLFVILYADYCEFDKIALRFQYRGAKSRSSL